MAVFKCKMCGGNLEVSPGMSVGTCDSCGTQQTLPKLEDEQKVHLYDRANHLRRNNEFDKASAMYERILQADSTDAEAYWSLVLCKYGVEYVEDPQTKNRIPTCNRTQFTSIFADGDYQAAISHADESAKKLYESEAQQIDEIQKGILEISAKEEPFDVFICYKEKDENGERTPDSVLAQDLYYELTQEGFKVFFARITLENKLGTAYEPYIFAALNSAKVMVVIGTKPENIGAVWVRNEWSRYLALIRQGAKKTLIPAYRDMDPYDLPEEFSHLQALDMGKLGFMQDLVRGIVKLTQVEKEEDSSPSFSGAVSDSSSQMIANNLKLAENALAGNNWSESISYANKVLEMDPECSSAWLVKMQAIALQSDKEQYRNMRLQEANYCGENAIKYAKEGNQEYCQELKVKAVEEMARGYVQNISCQLGMVEPAFSSSLALANITIHAVNQLMDASFLMEQLGEEIPFTMGMKNIVSSIYHTAYRYANALHDTHRWGPIGQQVNMFESRVASLGNRLRQLTEEEKAERNRLKKLAEQMAQRQKEINEAFWQAHADAYAFFTGEKERLAELAKSYDYSSIWRDMSIFLSKRTRQLQDILNAPRELNGELSSQEQALLQDTSWEAQRQELQRQGEQTIQQKKNELEEFKRELEEQKAIVANNRQLFGAGAKKRKAAQERIEELESKIYQAERLLNK